MPPEVLEMHKGESFAIGISVGVCIALAVMYYPLQKKDDSYEKRLAKIEKRIFKNG